METNSNYIQLYTQSGLSLGNQGSGQIFTLLVGWDKKALKILPLMLKLFKILILFWHLIYFWQVLVLHYENLKSDLKSEIRRVLNFLRLPIDESRYDISSFIWLKK